MTTKDFLEKYIDLTLFGEYSGYLVKDPRVGEAISKIQDLDNPKKEEIERIFTLCANYYATHIVDSVDIDLGDLDLDYEY